MASPREIKDPNSYNLASTSFDVNFDGVSNAIFEDLSAKEITMTESLLTPGLQTTIKLHSFFHNPTIKILNEFKNVVANIKVYRPILQQFGMMDELNVSARIYRLDNRKMINHNVEEFTVQGCDDTLLSDARNLVSKSWKCVSPSAVVEEVLRTCAGAKTIDLESSGPARDYIAENIHAFQAVTQQADVALAGDDPSFIHYMTYRNFSKGDPRGTHHFRSLKSLTAPNTGVARFFFQETGIYAGIGHPESILTYSFPCDFDYLSDILNGLRSSLVTINPMLKSMSLLGSKSSTCGMGEGQYMVAFTNFNSAQRQDSCNTDVEKHLLLRQARMGLLERDKIALRLTVPWNPVLHAGDVIEAYFINKNTKKYDNFGTGLYLIHSMTHNIKAGGYGTTTLDCVADTVGEGIV